MVDRKEYEAAPHLLDPQVLVWPPGGLEQGGSFQGNICVAGCRLRVERHCEPAESGRAPSPSREPSWAGADLGALALAQHCHVELQLVQLGPQGLLVAPHIPELLRQAICLLLDAQQVPGRGCRQPALGLGQR